MDIFLSPCDNEFLIIMLGEFNLNLKKSLTKNKLLV